MKKKKSALNTKYGKHEIQKASNVTQVGIHEA